MGAFKAIDCLVVGAGLSGSSIARLLAEKGKRVLLMERRGHIGGNMADYVDERGFLVQKYGPHVFHANKGELSAFMRRFEEWQDFKLVSGAVLDGKYTPVPFNFATIDIFYPSNEAAALKEKLLEAFPAGTATVLETLRHPDADIRGFAEFLFQKDYRPYTAKQWGIPPEEIDASVLERVPLRFSYEDGYFDDKWQILPRHSYTRFFENLLNHPNIRVELNVDACERLKAEGDALLIDGERAEFPVVYTGALDELFSFCFGHLPYRSLRFEWKYEPIDSLQKAPIVAYPQEANYTRITEYKKLPCQDKPGTSYCLEYPLPARGGGAGALLSHSYRSEQKAIRAIRRARKPNPQFGLLWAACGLQVLQHGSGAGAGSQRVLQRVLTPSGRLHPRRRQCG